MNLDGGYKKVAVVTGGNKGIGLQVVKILCERFDGDVFLCSRDEKRGSDAVDELGKLGLSPIFFKLDISHRDDRQRLRHRLERDYRGLDLLVNNAAVNFVPKKGRSDGENINLQILSMKINYFGTAGMCEDLMPIIKPGGRMINVSSLAGLLNFYKSPHIVSSLKSKALTKETLHDMANEYMDDLVNGRDDMKGWPIKGYAYFTSKILVTALTWVHQEELGARNVHVFAVHPGYVRTEMSGNMGQLTAEEGAACIVFAALEADVSNDYKRKIIFPSRQGKDWLSSNALDGMNVDQIVQLMVDWVKKMSNEP